MKQILLLISALLWYINATAQTDDMLERVQAISKNNIDYYNIDGITITCQETNIKFSKENICKGLLIKEEELRERDPKLKSQNFVLEKIEPLCDSIKQYATNYFIENEKNNITHVIYHSINKNDKKFQQVFNALILEKKIPKSVFNQSFFNTFNFAGRTVELNTYFCYWTDVNCIQCPYHGEMNWSVHKDSLDAVQSVKIQEYIATHCRKEIEYTVISNELVNVTFEGIQTKARKVVHLLQGRTATLLANTDKGKTETLTIYYIVAPVRNHYVSCIMSFWNNDLIEENTGLPSLLEKVMKL